MNRASLVCVAALIFLQACTASGPVRSALTDDELVSGDAFPWSGDPLPPVAAPEEAFGLDEEMRAFVQSLAAGTTAPTLRGLLAAMRARGLFDVVYTDTYTRTARGTFHERRGNCLSYTMLFVALARAAGFDARYQLVDVPPAWSNENGLVVVGMHVNAVVDTPLEGRFIVDFNQSDFREKHATRAISDEYAVALFYNNLGAEALGRREYAASLASLREAASTHADMPGPWVNLGVLYARHGLTDRAEAAYLRALDSDPHEQSALTNLVSVYKARGDVERADELRRRLRRYRDFNPYYHYAVAEIAYDQERFEDALQSLRIAIRLKRDDDEFYALQGRALLKLNRVDKAEASFARGKALAPMKALAPTFADEGGAAAP